MTCWTAIVPIKDIGARKTRLRPFLDDADIAALTDAMLGRVIEAASQAADVVIVANDRPRGWNGRLISDRGKGLNAALEAATRVVAGRCVILHADLPAIVAADVEALIGAAGEHGAIAPDRAGTGTNGLAIPHAPGRFAFGPDSCARHHVLMPGSAIVRRHGLAFDIDNPADITDATDAGLLPDWAVRYMCR